MTLKYTRCRTCANRFGFMDPDEDDDYTLVCPKCGRDAESEPTDAVEDVEIDFGEGDDD